MADLVSELRVLAKRARDRNRSARNLSNRARAAGQLSAAAYEAGRADAYADVCRKVERVLQARRDSASG